ncbi:MAG: hypothetical protein HZC12_09310, partial [Nitrospirae bacterium]|nr:hypothetical protein [Nitrospirota bacterium]
MKTINKKVIILLGLFLFLSFGSATAFAYDIYGKVYKADCSTAIPGATVKLYDYWL